MNRAERVFITGFSSLSSCGNTTEETWQSIIKGKTGIREIEDWDIQTWPRRLGGELKGFNPAKMLPDKKLLKVISRHDAMGIYAATQAVEHSGMIDFRDSLALDDSALFNEETAIYVGSPGNKYFQQYDFLPLIAKAKSNMTVFADELFNEVHPMWLLRILPNNVLAYTGITYGFKGANHNITNHAVGGMQAVIEGYHAIQTKQAARAVVVAYDMAIEPQGLFYYDELGVLSPSDLKPFDKAHNGTILGDGAAALILESESSVKARNAKCYGEVMGGFSATEGSHMFSIDEDGEPLKDLIEQTLTSLHLDPSDIDLIVAHGNGNKLSDVSEANALNQLFQNTPVTAFKWATGHTLCASGLLDTVLATNALHEQCIPGIANFSEPVEQFSRLDICAENRVIHKKDATALIINRGFGGMNACLIIKNCE